MQHIYLNGDFAGWRVSGRYLVSPDGQRITPERLRGLLFRDELELRRAGYAARRKAEAGHPSSRYGAKVKVVVVDLAEVRDRWGRLAS